MLSEWSEHSQKLYYKNKVALQGVFKLIRRLSRMPCKVKCKNIIMENNTKESDYIIINQEKRKVIFQKLNMKERELFFDLLWLLPENEKNNVLILNQETTAINTKPLLKILDKLISCNIITARKKKDHYRINPKFFYNKAFYDAKIANRPTS